MFVVFFTGVDVPVNTDYKTSTEIPHTFWIGFITGWHDPYKLHVIKCFEYFVYCILLNCKMYNLYTTLRNSCTSHTQNTKWISRINLKFPEHHIECFNVSFLIFVCNLRNIRQSKHFIWKIGRVDFMWIQYCFIALHMRYLSQ